MFDSIINELEELAMQAHKDIGFCELYMQAHFNSGQEEAFKKCIEIVNKYKEKNQKWIPVDERLPECDKCGISEDVLAYDDVEEEIYVAYYDMENQIWGCKDSFWNINITAWMPLPHIPKKEQKHYPKYDAKALHEKIKNLPYRNTDITFTFEEAQVMQSMLTLYNNVTGFDSKSAKRIVGLIDLFESEIGTMKNNDCKEFHKVFDVRDIELMKGAIC